MLQRDYEDKLVLKGAENIRITSVSDYNAGDTKILSAGSSQIHAVSAVVMHNSLGKHSVVLQLGLTERRAIVGDEHKLG